MKRYILKQGDVLEVPRPEKRVGYVRVIGKDEFGRMYQIHRETFEKFLDEPAFDGSDLSVAAIEILLISGAPLRWKGRP